MANTENIEAKLCAFVDGELDEAGRAEIEQHLVANPQHRQLMQELMKQRALLRELPRVKAPEDLLESVQNQMERSVLLDADTSGRGVAGRISRWPQFFAAAAVLVLAAGLVAVIVFVLPNHNRPPQDYAILTRTTTLPVDPAGPPAPAEIKSGVDDSALARREAKKDIFDKGGASDQLAMKGERASKSGEEKVFKNIFADSEVDRAVAEKLTQTPGVPDKSMLVVVSSDDPSATNREVQQYLQSNGIRWENVAEPMPPPLEQNQVVSPSRMQSVDRVLKNGKSMASPPLEQRAPADAKRNIAAGNKSAAAEGVPSAPAAIPATEQPGVETNPAQSQAKSYATASGSAAAIAPSTQPTAGVITAQQAPASIGTDQLAGQAGNPSQASVGQQLRLTQQPSQSQQYIVARGLTRDQVSGLNNVTNRNDGRNRVANYLRSGNSVTPTTVTLNAGSSQTFALPATQLGQLGQVEIAGDLTLRQQRERATLQDVAPPGGGGSQPTSAPLNVDQSRKEPDKAKQQLETPPAGAAPIQPPADETRSARPSEPVPGAPAPATAPLATPLATTTVTTAASATSPATTSIALAEERVDVVIVVQPESLPIPANVSATAPASTEAASTAPSTTPAATAPATTPVAP
jgi:hypothetical protein